MAYLWPMAMFDVAQNKLYSDALPGITNDLVHTRQHVKHYNIKHHNHNVQEPTSKHNYFYFNLTINEKH